MSPTEATVLILVGVVVSFAVAIALGSVLFRWSRSRKP